MDDGARDNESVVRSQPNTANIDSFPQVELVELSSLAASVCNISPESDWNNSKKGWRCWGIRSPRHTVTLPMYNFISNIHCHC